MQSLRDIRHGMAEYYTSDGFFGVKRNPYCFTNLCLAVLPSSKVIATT
jgi:hypothetical protein